MDEEIELRISLNYQDFKNLVDGKIIDVKPAEGFMVQIALQDIGYDRMIDIVQKSFENYKKTL